MLLAILQALQAYRMDEVPVGAVLVDWAQNYVVHACHNKVNCDKSVVHHAEMLVLEYGSRYFNTKYLDMCDLYVTIEPCNMCSTAISYYKIRNLYFGCYETKFGAIESNTMYFNQKSCFHKPDIYYGLFAEESKNIIQSFFLKRRKKKKCFRVI